MKKNELILKSIENLREKSDAKKLVIFVGSGVSTNVSGMPSWADLINKMADFVEYNKCDYCKSRDNCEQRSKKRKNNNKDVCINYNDYSSDEYLKIPQYAYNKNDRKYYEIIKKNISSEEFPKFSLSKAIFELYPIHIVTTNYDKIIESSDDEYRSQFDTIVTDKDLLSANHTQYIIKMHGDISDTKSIVLKEQDYLDYSQNHILIELFVKSLLVDHTFLFLGYSLNDYNVKQIVSWINYLKAQNKVEKNKIPQRRKIGYIVLDDKTISNDTVKYFRNNNIEVLNIHSIPIVNNVPSDLSKDKGQRLYSFLSIIKNSSLDELLSPQQSIDDAVAFVSKHKTYDYILLLDALHIKEYRKVDTTVYLYSEEMYKKLKEYIEGESKNVEVLKRLFKNVGVNTIVFNDEKYRYVFQINDKYEMEKIEDGCYLSYLQNDYKGLLSYLENEGISIFQKNFYKQFIYSNYYLNVDYSNLDFDDLTKDEKISYLHNQAVISYFNRNRRSFEGIKKYINNIASPKERDLYKYYIDMYEGNKSKRFEMMTSLKKLKENVSSKSTFFFEGYSIGELYNIQNVAIPFYHFVFDNRLLIIGFSETEMTFHDYIEAIICASSDEVEEPGNGIFSNFIRYEKYKLSKIDIDIISKYISTKELYELLKTYNITGIQINEEDSNHLVLCFSNLVDSLIEKQTYGYCQKSIMVLSNLALIIRRTTLNENRILLIQKAFVRIFENKQFIALFWNITCIDLIYYLRAFSELANVFNGLYEINCINNIVQCKSFYDVINHYGNDSEKLIRCFISRHGNNQLLYKIIDCETDIGKKAALLRIFFEKLPKGKKGKEYKNLLEGNYSSLSIADIYYFVLRKWIEPSTQDITSLVQELIDSYHKKNKFVKAYPDPIKRKLELVYIFYISDVIDDISKLEELCEDYSHLRFLLHPDSFNYQEVDFSNYMWQNFARTPKYLPYFIKNKEAIIPRIEERIKQKKETLFERKILWGYFLKDKTEL